MNVSADNLGDAAAMGRLEFVVESRHPGGRERWLVVRPESSLAPQYRALGVALSPGCRVVLDAATMRLVGVLVDDLPEPPSPCGYNPYFDMPPP